MSLTVALLIAASATAATKEILVSDPMLAGSKIYYCDEPKDCHTIDRRNEPFPEKPIEVMEKLAFKFNEISPRFHTLNVTFVKSDEVPGSFDMKLKYTYDPTKDHRRVK